MDLDLELLNCIGYDNSKMKILNNTVICYLSGSCLVEWDLITNTQKQIQSKKQGFQNFETNPKQGMLVLVEHGLKPDIYVYKDNQLIKTIKDIIDYEVLDIKLSIDGQKLAIVQGCPSYKLILYDLKEEKLVEGDNCDITINDNDYLDLQFNPQDSNVFAILNNSHLIIYKLESVYKKDQNDENNITKQYRVEINQSQLTENVQIKLMLWDQINNIYLSQDNIICLIRSEDMQVILKKEMKSVIKHILMTQKHIITCYKNNYIEWLYKYDPQFANDKNSEVFTMDKYYLFLEGQIDFMCYDHFYNNIIINTDDYSVYLLNIKGQNIMEDEVDDQNQEKAESQLDEEEENNNKIECDALKLGPHLQGEVIFLKQLNNYDLVLVATNKAEIQVLDIQSRNIVRNYNFNIAINSFEIDQNDKLIVMGTKQGCVRFLDCRDFNNIQTVQIIKLYDNKVIDFTKYYQNNILVGSKSSKKIFVLQKNNNNEQYNLQGILCLPSKLINITIENSNNHFLVMMNYLILQVYKLEELNEQGVFQWKQNQIKCRKVDPNLNIGISMKDRIYMLGKDKVLKQYNKCEDYLYNYDLKIKVPANTPQHEYYEFQMGINQTINNQTHIVFGGKDGRIYLSHIDELDKIQQLQVQSMQKGGVSALSINKDNSLLLVGGFDGSIFVYNINKSYEYECNNNLKVNEIQIPYSNFNNIEDNQIVNYRQNVIEQSIYQKREGNREQEEKVIDELQQLKKQLQILLEQNTKVDQIEQLDRDEFCIDLKKREQMNKQCQTQQEKLEKVANSQIQIQKQIFQKIKEQSYDLMQIHLKAINGIKNNIIVYNYQIKNQTEKQKNKLKNVMQLRNIEIQEKYLRIEQKIKELINIQELCKHPENYIINAYSGKPQQFVYNDYEKKEEIKEKKGEQDQTQNNLKNKNMREFKGFQVFRNANLSGIKDEAKQNQNKVKENENQQESMQQIEDTQQQIQELQQQIQNKKNISDLSLWDYLYSQLEIYSNNQKRNQIIIIENIIQDIKKCFNKEFEDMSNYRQQMIDNINEKNKRINEIQIDLKMEQEQFQAKKNILDNPESILDITKEELGIERYLSKEEKKKKEEEREKEQERLRLLQQDDAGIRAIKQMMGGTLQEKKETPLTENLEREEWMNMPAEEMDDDQRAKLREFEQKEQQLKEEKDKITKNLKNELQKLQYEVIDLAKNYDDKLTILLKRKLEFDQRINEQYVYIIKMVQSILVGGERINKIIEMENFIQALNQQIQLMQQQIQELKIYNVQLSEQKKQAQENYQNSTLHIPHKGQELSNIQIVYNSVFEDVNNMAQRQKDDQANFYNLQQYQNQLFQLDPYNSIELKNISDEREQQFENYINYIMQKFQYFQMNIEDENLKNQVLQMFRNKFNFKLQFEKEEKQYNDLQKYLQYQQQQLKQQQDLYNDNIQKQEQINDIQNQMKSDIEIQIKIKQGNVEIFQDRPVPSLLDAILIPQSIIDRLNREIRKQGEAQIEALDHIKNTKFDVAKAEYDKRKRYLELKQLEVKIGQIQMLKVKKEMQIALQKKDINLNENELRNLQEQMSKIKETTDKRISIIKKKEESILKEIQFILKENQQLLVQGANLSQTVKQRKEIKDMLEKKMNVKDEKHDEAFEKLQSIAQAKRLYDHAVKQAEEIQLLKDELSRLKDKTFPDFNNYQNTKDVI